MVNNPFRAKTNLRVQDKADDWGKTKFKPNKFGGNGGGKGKFQKHGGGNKPFNRKFDNRKGGFQKNKEVSKFNQVDRDARPENATPWNKFKDEIVFQQREDEQTAQRANMDSEEGKKILKQREISYRKMLIEQKKQEPTQWDDFGEESKSSKLNKNSSNPQNQDTDSKNKSNSKNKQKFKKNKNPNKDPKETMSELDKKSKTKFKNPNTSNVKLKADVKEFISKELLDNFDSKKLNVDQNNALRSILTKTAATVNVPNLKGIVKDMKYQKQKKQKKNKNFQNK